MAAVTEKINFNFPHKKEEKKFIIDYFSNSVHVQIER